MAKKSNMVLHKTVHFCDHLQLSQLPVFLKAGKLA